MLEMPPRMSRSSAEEIDEAVDGAPVGEQPHDAVHDLLEVERRADRRDELGRTALDSAHGAG
jgi:hypothetical protein